MCNDPVMRTSASGFCGAYFSRIAISPGISFSAIEISLRPQSASEMSATLKSCFVFVWLVAVLINFSEIDFVHRFRRFMQIFRGAEDDPFVLEAAGSEIQQ